MQERFDGIDTGMFADLLDGRGFEGAMTGLRPVWDGQRFHGPAFVVKMLQARVGTFSAEDIALGRILEAASPGDAIVIDAGGAPIAVWGELVALAAINKGVVGVVADAGVRDADILKELKFPVMSRHLSPAAGKTRLKVVSMNEEMWLTKSRKWPGNRRRFLGPRRSASRQRYERGRGRQRSRRRY